MKKEIKIVYATSEGCSNCGFCIGDEITDERGCDFVITAINSASNSRYFWFEGIDAFGNCNCCCSKSAKATGRHFDITNRFLAAIQN